MHFVLRKRLVAAATTVSGDEQSEIVGFFIIFLFSLYSLISDDKNYKKYLKFIKKDSLLFKKKI